MYSGLVVRARGGAAYCFGTWNKVFISLWRLAATPEGVSEMNRMVRVFILEEQRAGPGPVHFLGVVEPTSPPPNDVAREALATFSRDTIPKMGVAVLVAEGGPFRSAFVRAVGVALTTLMPHRVPFKFVTTVEEAGPHFSQYLLPSMGGVEALRRAVDELRAEIPAAAVRT